MKFTKVMRLAAAAVGVMFAVSATATDLYKAAGSGKTDEVKNLIKNGANVNAKNKDGWTPLMKSAQNGRWRIVSLLLKAGANVNAKNKDGGTPLMLAASGGRAKIVGMLLKAGSKVNEKDKGGYSAIMHFTASLIVLLEDEKDGEDDDDDDTGEREPVNVMETLKLLIKAGANVNVQDKEDGTTPLMNAVNEGNAEIVKILLKVGADVNIKNDEGKTALDFARKNKDKSVVKLLKAAGAK